MISNSAEARIHYIYSSVRKFFKPTLLLITTSLILLGCPGMEDNEVEDGLVMHFAEVHGENMPVSTTAIASTATISRAVTTNATGSSDSTLQITATGDPLFTIADATGGYDNINLEHHTILDGSGHLVSLYRAFVVIQEIELIPCAELSQLPRRLLDSIIPKAHAHAGHGSEPVGGRALDKPNVISIVTQDEYYLALGDKAVAPGRYCAVRVSLARFNGDGYGKPEVTPASTDDPITVPGIPDMNGKMFVLRADYCSVDDGSGNCLMRSKIDIDDSDLTIPAAKTIVFNQALTVSSSVREAYIAVGIAYGVWMQNVDASLLATDAIERQQLLDNIANSLHIYAKGVGDLPPNVAL
jgi:hypothetical protein